MNFCRGINIYHFHEGISSLLISGGESMRPTQISGDYPKILNVFIEAQIQHQP